MEAKPNKHTQKANVSTSEISIPLEETEKEKSLFIAKRRQRNKRFFCHLVKANRRLKKEKIQL